MLLNDSVFCGKWAELYENCHWGTFFQSHQFVKLWFEHYRENFSLIFIIERNANNDLIGFMPLTQEKVNGRISAAGAYLAEYQTWLATLENSNSFIEKTFELLKQEFPGKDLQLLFLAPKTPLEFLNKQTELSDQSELRPHLRPLIEVGKGETFQSSLKKRGNKTRIRQLQKLGEIRLEKLQTPEELESIFDEIEDYSRLRLSALHNFSSCGDTHRKDFHKALMAIPDLMYASVLRVGGKIASAKISIRNRDEMLLSITAMSPFLARQSPSKIHILMLGLEFAEKGIGTFDLSPGSGYKERFATHSENAFSLHIFFAKRDFQKHISRNKVTGFTRKTLEKLNITKTGAFRNFERIQTKIKRVRYRTIPYTIFKNIKRKVREQIECRIYAMPVEHINSLPASDLMQQDSISDLLRYSPAEGWQLTTGEFHQTCLARFEAGNHSYTRVENGKLVHSGWLIERQEISHVFEVDQEFILHPDSAVLFDYYTRPEARGRGFYRASLLQGLHDAAKIAETKYVYIGVLADNIPSRRVIEKLGFIYQGSLFKKTTFGKIEKWKTGFSLETDSQNIEV